MLTQVSRLRWGHIMKSVFVGPSGWAMVSVVQLSNGVRSQMTGRMLLLGTFEFVPL